MKRLVLLLLLSTPAWATWTKVQSKNNTSCTGTTCAVTVSSTGSGNLLVAVFVGSPATISSASGGGTWALCSASACHIGNASFALDAAYVLSSSSGATSVSITLSASLASWTAEVIEYSYTRGPVSFDIANTRTGSCTPSCVGVALALTGTNEALVQYAAGGPNVTAIDGTYTNPADFVGGASFAGSINTTSGTAPTWTLDSSGTMLFGGLSFTEAAVTQRHSPLTF